MQEEVPFHEVVFTTSGVAFRNMVTGGMTFIPFVAPAPVAEVAVVPVAEVAAPALLTTRTTRVAFGQTVVVWNATFTDKLEIVAPSSGAVIEERFKDGSVRVQFVGLSRQTWTI